MENYLTVNEAAAKLPGKVRGYSVWRWCKFGLPDPNEKGKRIYCESVRVSGKVYVTWAWVSEFVKTMGLKYRVQPSQPVPTPPRRTSDAVRQRRIKDAKRELAHGRS